MSGMTELDSDWTRRHIAAFRYHRGHQACTVAGCIGSQPLMWVPTEAEDNAMPVLEAEVIVLAAQAQIALDDVAMRKAP